MMPNRGRSTIFLSHSAGDRSAARYIYRLLTDFGFDVWFDEASLVPGEAWESAMLEGLAKSRLVLILIGTKRPGKWQAREIRSALENVHAYTKVIPVLLPGSDVRHLPAEMRSVRSIDLTSIR